MRAVRFIIPLCLTATLAVVSGWYWGQLQSTANQTSSILQTNQELLAVQLSATAQPLMVVVPHHNLVATKRQAVLAKLANESQPQTIILVSPNHYDLGTSDVLTTNRVWSINNNQAQIQPAASLIHGLVATNVARIQDSVFDNEHGIKNLLDDIHTYFPEAQLLPVIFKSTTTPAEATAVLDHLLLSCAECGVIASVDMSHYQPAAMADIHDVKTIRALTSLDEQEIWEVEVDSNPSLAFLVQWAKAHEADRFMLFDHTNSGFLAGNPDTETTTHIFGSYSAGLAQTPDRAFTFTVAGDAMFGRAVQNFQTDYTQLFSQLGNRTFWGTDLSLLNLEGPLSDQPVTQITEHDPLVFNFPPQTIEALTYLKLTTLGLANNHTLNQGQTGLETTHQLLAAASLDWVGNPSTVSSEQSVRRYEAGGMNISLIALSDFGDLSGAEDLIQAEHEAGQFVLIYVHWGTEYAPTHSRRQEDLATTWSKAGADLIIGAHPHVIQDATVINQTLVFYSLGNFIFDQFFSTETQQGLILSGVITDQQLKVVLVPVQSSKLKPAILQGEAKQVIISHVCQNISSICSQGIITVPR